MPQKPTEGVEPEESGNVFNVESLLIDLYHIEQTAKSLENKVGRDKIALHSGQLRKKLDELFRQIEASQNGNARLTEALGAAKEQIAALRDEVDKLAAPPRPYGIFLGVNSDNEPLVFTAGRKLAVSCSPGIEIGALRRGQEVELNEALNIVKAGGFDPQGEVAKLKEVLDEKRLLVTLRADEERVVEIAEPLMGEKFKIGDVLKFDPRSGYVLERLPKQEVGELMLEKAPDVTISMIGGLKTQVDQLIEAIEWPAIYPDQFKEHQYKPPKGILIYGPPGCGKTLIAKAIANLVAQRMREKSGDQGASAYFMNIKGPQLLNKYVGETERKIREIFQRAKELAAQGHIVVVFFDEFESMFRTRGSGISSDVESTIVPQFLAEMDGVDELNNVVVIGATNRQDLVDPAVLRPGRFDLKIKVDRPDEKAADEILRVYVNSKLPWGEDTKGRPYVGQKAHKVTDRLRGDKECLVDLSTPELMVDHIVKVAIDYIYYAGPPIEWMDGRGNKIEWNTECVELTWAGGNKKRLHIKDLLVSGAMLTSIVARVKKAAIKRLIVTGKKGITMIDLYAAIRDEIKENGDLPNTNNPDDWAKILGQQSETGQRVVHVRPLIGSQTSKNKTKKVEIVEGTGHYL